MLGGIEKQLLIDHCKDFINSTDKPLIKSLYSRSGTFEKVKVRHRPCDIIGECFNNAFADKGNNIYNRGIFINENNVSVNTYYVMPVNGYRFLYSKEIKNLHNYVNRFITEVNTTPDIMLISDMLRLSYIDEKLHVAQASHCEIVIYNIPFFYAVKTSSISNYHDLIKELKDGSC